MASGFRAARDTPSLRMGGWGSYRDVKVLGSDGQIPVTRSDSSDRTLTIAASRQVLRWRRPGRSRQARGPAYVDATTGNPVLWIIGTHFDFRAETAVLFPGQRRLRFPVQGSSVRNAVMTAVDESGTTLLWFRKPWGAAVEVVVSPGCGLTPEVLCAVAVARSWLEEYFQVPRRWRLGQRAMAAPGKAVACGGGPDTRRLRAV
jgi:hypothetical protein